MKRKALTAYKLSCQSATDSNFIRNQWFTLQKGDLQLYLLILLSFYLVQLRTTSNCMTFCCRTIHCSSRDIYRVCLM